MEPAPGHRIISARAVLHSCRRKAVLLSQTCPAAIFLMAAVIAVLSVRGNGFPFVPFIPTLSLLAAFALLPRRNALLQFGLPMLAVLISAWYWIAGQQNLVAEAVGRSKFAAEAELVVTDPSVSMQPGEAFRVKHFTCRLERLRFGGDGPWIEFAPRQPSVLLECGWDGPASVPVGFGDRIRSNGVFAPPNEPLLPGGFDYAAFLEQDGIYEIFRPDETFRIVSRGTGFRHWLYRIRDAVLARICAGFRDGENVRLASAMLGGHRIPLRPETRGGFLSSGTIHILSVSGTHVAIAATLLLLLTLWIPFRPRCFVVLLPLLIYALSTGMREPAMRAFIMIGVFLLLRALLVPSLRMNNLMLAAYVILLVSPGSLTNPGMHYSFTAVAMLLSLPANPGRTILKLISRGFTHPVPLRYMPTSRRIALRLAEDLLTAVSAAAVASLGSGVLTILYQGLFPVSAVPANVLVLPLAYMVFILAAAALFFCWMPPVSILLSVLLEHVFRLIAGTGRFFGGLCELTVPNPPVWSVAVFLAALFLLFRVKRFRTGAVLVALMTALFGFWCLRPKFMPREILVADSLGAGSEPAVIVADPALGRADVVNVPDYRLGQAFADWLGDRGIGVCRSVAVSSGRKASFDGLDVFSARIPVLDIYCPSNAVSKMPDGIPVAALPYEGAFNTCRISGDLFSFSVGTISGELLSNDVGNGRLTLRRDGVLLMDDALTPDSAYRFHTLTIERTAP